jgi:hypothetical protein
MWRRELLALPYADQIPTLARFLGEDSEIDLPLAIDPARLVDAALHHRVAGYLVRAARNGQLRLPAVEQERLDGSTSGSALYAAILRHQLGQISETLADACGTPPLALKGPVLAELFYPERQLRPYFDLDLLIPRFALDRASAALEARGFERVVEFRPGYAERYGHDVHLRRTIADHRIDVELHWRVGDDPVGLSLSHERLYPDAELVDIDAATVAVPAAAAHLLVLAVHLLSDREKRLCWINDVALVARSLDPPAWTDAFALGDELGVGWPLDRALDYAARHAGYERTRPRPPAPAPAWGPLRAVEELNVRASPHLGRLAVLDWRERARFLAAVLFPTRAGLSGTVGDDGAGTLRLVGRHARQAVAGLAPRRGSSGGRR